MLLSIPTTVEITQDWLVKYWAEQLGISIGRLIQAVGVVGPDVSKLRKYLKDGHRIAIRDETGVARLAVRIVPMCDGFGVSVPYHSSKQGWVFEQPVRYDRGEYVSLMSEARHFTVDDTVKLSIHLNGFVQFSSAGGRPIVSGYNGELNQVKGAGLCAPDPVIVTTGPLFGIILQGLPDFKVIARQQAEIFEAEDMWSNHKFSTPEDTAYNLEVFMFPNRLLGAARFVGKKRMLKRQLPFDSRFKFSFDLRVVELPGLSVFLGVILSHIRPDDTIKSGYKISGPGCGEPGKQKKSIGAWYPRPDFVGELNPTSLDYQPNDEGM